MSRRLVNELMNLLKIDWYVNNQQPIAAQYFGLYADPSDICKNAVRRVTIIKQHGVTKLKDVSRSQTIVLR